MASLDPGVAAQPSDKVITLGIYDPLTTYVDGKVVPYLAESIEGRRPHLEHDASSRTSPSRTAPP